LLRKGGDANCFVTDCRGGNYCIRTSLNAPPYTRILSAAAWSPPSRITWTCQQRQRLCCCARRRRRRRRKRGVRRRKVAMVAMVATAQLVIVVVLVLLVLVCGVGAEEEGAVV
jgi:hypothetical protein